MRARFVVRISPGDVGERVTVRALDPAGGYVDVLGYLRRWADDVLEIERKDGTLVRVHASALVAGRTLGPPPQRPPRRR